MNVASHFQINGDRLDRSISELATIGQLKQGGVSRVAFTPEDLAARERVKSWMEAAGMTVRVDAAGNMIGRYPGQESTGALATGSHIDTVPVAGRYDGTLGVLAGIEVVRVLQENNHRLKHPIEVIVFTDEENSVIGCKAMAGTQEQDPERMRRRDGRSIQECLQQIGGEWSQIQTARRLPGEIAAFVELHVEQGGVLELAEAQIGVVKGIVGQYRFIVTVTGRPNHAGTTPMDQRKDALVAAAQMVLAVHQGGTETPGEQVATVGSLQVFPNAPNIVPGRVEFTIDLRDLSERHLEGIRQQLMGEFQTIATATGTEFTIQQILHVDPTLAAPKIQQVITEICDNLGYSHLNLPSRAGHDAQEIGRFAEMGMIFVPSVSGISHAEDEYTPPEDCARGATVLLQTFLRLDEIYE